MIEGEIAREQGAGASGASGGAGAERIARAFADRRGTAALMPYMMGGFPTLEQSLQIGRAYIEAGAELIELGVPYSDPLADGPVIHEAGTAALAAGVQLGGVLEIARELAENVPVVLMAYANMALAPGLDRFLERIGVAGVSGLIVPDLSLEESGRFRASCDDAGVALVPLAAPTTTDERFARIGANARGFLYAVSVVGTTGERAELSQHYEAVLDRAKQSTQLPVALGFGISGPRQAALAAAAGADGVIIGTRMVRAAAEAESSPAEAVAEVLADIATGLQQR